MKNFKNVVYILTNPLYAGYVKIGYASDLYARLASLNTGMLRNFEPYAVYETDVKNADVHMHDLIDNLAPIVRARVIYGQKVQDKEFFKLEPEQAYELLKHIAKMTGTEHKLHIEGEDKPELPLVQPYIPNTEAMTITNRNYTINDKFKPLFEDVVNLIKSVNPNIEEEQMAVYFKYTLDKKIICSICSTGNCLKIFFNMPMGKMRDGKQLLKDCFNVGHHGVGGYLLKCSDKSHFEDIKDFLIQTIKELT